MSRRLTAFAIFIFPIRQPSSDLDRMVQDGPDQIAFDLALVAGTYSREALKYGPDPSFEVIGDHPVDRSDNGLDKEFFCEQAAPEDFSCARVSTDIESGKPQGEDGRRRRLITGQDRSSLLPGTL